MNTMKIIGAKFHTEKLYVQIWMLEWIKLLYWTLKYRKEVNDIEITRCTCGYAYI